MGIGGRSCCNAALALIAILALAACERRQPLLSDAEMREMQEILPGMTGECVERVRFGGLEAFPAAVENCFEMTPQQQWSGLWRNDFEGSRFCPGPAEECDYESPGDQIWLSYSEQLSRAGTEPPFGYGGLYEIEFVGRRTLRRGQFGHSGGFDHEIVVDRLIALKELQAPTHE